LLNSLYCFAAKFTISTALLSSKVEIYDQANGLCDLGTPPCSDCGLKRLAIAYGAARAGKSMR
jgi:hypothetical protein